MQQEMICIRRRAKPPVRLRIPQATAWQTYLHPPTLLHSSYSSPIPLIRKEGNRVEEKKSSRIHHTSTYALSFNLHVAIQVGGEVDPSPGKGYTAFGMDLAWSAQLGYLKKLPGRNQQVLVIQGRISGAAGTIILPPLCLLGEGGDIGKPNKCFPWTLGQAWTSELKGLTSKP